MMPDGHKCTLCPHECQLGSGEFGKCNVRMGSDLGILFTGYGRITNIAIEPIEKRPLFHFMPGTKFLSAGGHGCSMSCDFCMNWKVSQSADAKSKYLSPLELLTMAIERGAKGICLTYNEPTVYAEYVVELGELSRYRRIPLVLKTNGYVNEEPWRDICRITSAINIDLKGTGDQYVELGAANRQDQDASELVLKRLEEAYISGVHVEVSVPVMPQQCVADFERVRDFLANLNPDIPVHLLKVFPAYMHSADTTADRLIADVRKFFKHDMKYVYTDKKRDTVCSDCKTICIIRRGFDIAVGVKGNRECGECDRLDAQFDKVLT
jgi:pyruvate formate lyase activating enzyme